MSGASRPPSRLARLDDRIVPVIRRGARRAVQVTGAPFRALRRLEDRVAARPVRVLLRFRQLLVLVTALVLFAGSYVHLQRYPDLRAAASREGGQPTSGSADGGDTLPGAVPFVGPTVNEDVAGYVEDRRAALAAADDADERLAIVSFVEYLTGEEASALVGDGFEVVRVQIRVPAAEQPPVDGPADDGLVATVRRTVDTERARIAGEEAALNELLESGSVEEKDFEEVYRADLDALAAARDLLDAGGGTVFAVVVRAPVGALRALAEHERVRLVDLAPTEADPDSSTFYGLLPEDRDEVSFGALR